MELLQIIFELNRPGDVAQILDATTVAVGSVGYSLELHVQHDRRDNRLGKIFSAANDIGGDQPPGDKDVHLWILQQPIDCGLDCRLRQKANVELSARQCQDLFLGDSECLLVALPGPVDDEPHPYFGKLRGFQPILLEETCQKRQEAQRRVQVGLHLLFLRLVEV